MALGESLGGQLPPSGIPADAVYLTWNDVYGMTLGLADKIETHCVATGETFDNMVVIPRGSYYPANIVSRRLGFDSTSILHAGIGTYKDGESERTGEFRYGQMPLPEQVAGRNLLVIEEVCDTGNTLQHFQDLCRMAGADWCVRVFSITSPNGPKLGLPPIGLWSRPASGSSIHGSPTNSRVKFLSFVQRAVSAFNKLLQYA